MILSIPYELAVDVTPALGTKQDPLNAALRLLELKAAGMLPEVRGLTVVDHCTMILEVWACA